MIKKVVKRISFGAISLVAFAWFALFCYFKLQTQKNLGLLGEPAPKLTIDSYPYRDLNKNGRLDLYEDKRLSPELRVDDLLSQMSVAEKAGTMFISQIASRNGGDLIEHPVYTDVMSLGLPSNSELIAVKLMNSFNVMFVDEPGLYARWQNKIQALAERTRLGIPVTFASDPRHGFGSNPAASLPAGNFSLWPEPLGMAATRDPSLVEEFGRYANEEYRAVGIRLALHPMADLATEPRWARAAGTFGEDATLSAKMTKAYIKGFQGERLNDRSVATMVKHFSGGGPQAEGRDAHFPYGKEQTYPGNNFDYHLIPFSEGAFPANPAQIMPYYGIPVGQTSEDVGFAFNREIITDMLRGRFGFEGVVCSDWGLLTDSHLLGVVLMKKASAWGVEHLTVEQRMVKLLDAGVDQFGGEYIPEVLVGLIEQGVVKEARLDESVRRILLDKFRLGLFDDPYVSESVARKIVGNKTAVEAGIEAQRKSLVLLKNGNAEPVLPLKLENLPRKKIYLENIDPELVKAFADVVSEPGDADLAVIRLDAPYYPNPGIFDSNFHSGDLDFKGAEKERLIKLMATVPTVVNIYLDRAAVIPELAENSAALVANFGAVDQVLIDLLLGRFNPTGRLPIELPRSMEAVQAQLEDLPYDSVEPLFPYDFGLTFHQE
jgi:beta-glucosidase